MKVVVTGGAGFIGSHLTELLSSEKFDVHVIDNFRSGYKKNLHGIKNVNLHEGSITDPDLVNEVIKDSKYVFNLAALVSVPESIEQPDECIQINVSGLLNILEASKIHNVEKVIHASTAAIYGDDPTLPKKVTMLPQPKSPYAVTKLDGEYHCKKFKEQFGLNTISLRFFNVFGPRQDPKSQYAAAIPILIEQALNNEPITIHGDGEQTRDFIYVNDVARANYLAAIKPDAHGVYNIARGSSITINQLAEKIISLTGSKSEIVHLEERKGDVKHSLAYIEDTKEALGFSPQVNFDEELIETINYFRKS